ncbi:MAG: hypothetical protein RBU45_20735, partial [Myxococcota bacterium]|nr:hypothetical protein [Myxococcota bacterium]
EPSSAAPAPAPLAEEGWRTAWRDPLAWLLVLLLTLLFATLKTYGLRPDLGDEGIYFYDALATAQGAIPYRDYPLAHPPLNILLLAGLYLLFGPSVLLGKLLPPLCALGTGLLLLRLGRRHLGPALDRSRSTPGGSPAPAPGTGWIVGLGALALYLTAFDLLRCSTHFTGANLGTLLAVWAVERALARRPLQAGSLVGLAALAGLYAAPAPALAAFLLLLPARRAVGRFVAALAGVFAGANLLCLVVAGRAFVDQVYLFHLAKPPHRGGNLPLWQALARDNLPLVGLGLCGLLLGIGVLLQRGRRAPAARTPAPPPPPASSSPPAPVSRPIAAAILALAGSAGVVLLLNRVFTYYFVPLYPWLALLGGLYLAWVAGLARESRRLPVQLATIGLALLLTLAAGWLGRLALDPHTADDIGKVKRYRFFAGTLFPGLDPLVRGAFWYDERRLDRHYFAPTRYLWHESRYSEALPTVAAEIVRRGAPDDLLFGDSLSAPIVALLAGRRLAGDLADTNRQHYLAGIRRAADDLERVDGPRLRWVVCRGRVAACGEPAVWSWLQGQFTLHRRYPDARSGTSLLLFRRHDRPPPAAP